MKKWRSGRCWPSLRQGKALDGEVVHIETAGGRENQDNEQSFKGVDSTFRLGSGALLQLLGKPLQPHTEPTLTLDPRYVPNMSRHTLFRINSFLCAGADTSFPRNVNQQTSTLK